MNPISKHGACFTHEDRGIVERESKGRTQKTSRYQALPRPTNSRKGAGAPDYNIPLRRVEGEGNDP